MVKALSSCLAVPLDEGRQRWRPFTYGEERPSSSRGSRQRHRSPFQGAPSARPSLVILTTDT